jgi:hypothetical protein
LPLAGCGPGTGDISGTIRYNGAPLPGGRITFISEENRSSPMSAPIREDGTYTVNACPRGPARITVQTFPAGTSGKGRSGLGAGRGTTRGPRQPVIPERYSDPGKTDLAHTVTRGRQNLDIELKR